MNVQTTITPAQLRAIHNLVSLAADHIEPGTYMASESDAAHLALAAMAHDIYTAWTQLPDGSALKTMTHDDVWHPASPAEMDAYGE